MTKQELESRIGYELTQEGWKHLENMYMGCELDKDTFAKIIKSGAKIFKVEEKKNVVYKGILIKWIDYMGCYAIQDTFISFCRGTYYDHLEEAKKTIKEVMESHIRYCSTIRG